jgi:hypothetical protein
LFRERTARVCKETGQEFFSSETVERIQALIEGGRPPARVIDISVLEYAQALPIAKTSDSITLVHEGGDAAEIRVELIEDETGWSPYLSHEDALKRADLEVGAPAGAGARSRCSDWCRGSTSAPRSRGPCFTSSATCA